MDTSRFWLRVDKTENCWLWTGTRKHGRFRYGRVKRDGRWMLAHRFIWEEVFGPIPAGHNVCHRCDNPSCVRPDHLFVAQQRENVADMDRKGRRGVSRQFGNRNRATLTESDVLVIRRRLGDGDRQWRIARDYGVTPHAISAIARGKTWTHLA